MDWRGKIRARPAAASALLAVLAAASSAPRVEGAMANGRVRVAVASSLSAVMGPIAAACARETGVDAAITTGSSNTIARQIVEGAPVDLFVSADRLQMDLVDRADRLEPGTRVDLVANRLVVVVFDAAPGGLPAGMPRALRDPRVRRIAMGNPDSVPAGVYGREWLAASSLWDAVKAKVVPFPTVRAALGAVAEGRVDAGIVYVTDARTEPRVRVVHEAAGAAAPRITYPMAVVRGPREREARAVAACLRGPAARAAFAAAGFGAIDGR